MSRRRAVRACGRLLRDDRGSGTVLVLALVAVVVILTVGVVALVGAVATRSAVQSAADLAALAAAAAVQRSVVEPCGHAAQVVERHGARLVRCGCSLDLSCAVEASLRTRTGLVATAAARAGPRSAATSG